MKAMVARVEIEAAIGHGRKAPTHRMHHRGILNERWRNMHKT